MTSGRPHVVAKASGDPRVRRHLPGPAARDGRTCPIVGIGASAGGLEAFTQLLKQLPPRTGFGFVLVQHLDPQHESALAQLLTRVTAMPVREVTNNLRVEADHVYIIPPNTGLCIARGVLKLQPRPQNRTAPRSIDFFESLAKDQRERAIGVILSGTATDGTLGLEAIKAEGGLTFAQDVSARYDSMPRNAIAAGCVDFVLSPGNIARELARIARHPYVEGRAPAPLAPADEGKGMGMSGGNGFGASGVEAQPSGHREQNGYQKILLLLRNYSGVDFSLYKSTTIHRRIKRRTVLSRRNTLEDYADFLRGNDKELGALYSDALIGVTSFFRNADAFGVLQRKVFLRLLQQDGNEPLRVWVLGCSTGQEAYSIAMAFAESAGKIPRARRLQVFATDLNEANLDKARKGFYPKSIAQDVSEERLRRFFIEEEGCYRVIKPLRELVVFARQNVISDPPFSRMDLISCRNMLIYLEPSLQKKVLPTFHYALKPGGFLFLGASESIGRFSNLFVPVDKKQKIYLKKAAPTSAFHLPLREEGGRHPLPGGKRPLPGDALRPALLAGGRQGRASDAFRSELNAEREADRVTVRQFAPPAVLINADLQILQFRGPTGAYLEPPTGKASFDLLKMAREGLMLPLRSTINSAKKENKTVRRENVPVNQNGKIRAVNVEVVPLKNLNERCFLVLFEDCKSPGSAEPDVQSAGRPDGATRARRLADKKEESSCVAGLEQDLSEARDYLQSVQEHQEAANEELQVSNEEGQSANEELQSLNEELETSKEELESTNEELTTLNEEMLSQNTELNRLNSDLTNFQTSTKLVIVLLGRDLTVRRFSAEAGRQFNLLLGDIGRPIGSVRHNLDLIDLDAVIAKVIAHGRECEREVRDREGRWYSLRVRPYVTVDCKVDGAVLVLVDISDLEGPEQLITEAQAQLSRHAEQLERLVAERTVELTVANRRLVTSVDDIRKSKDKYRALLAESQAMQKKLRHLTHQIITAQEDERKDISRELHDEVVQTLIGINVELSALGKRGAAGERMLKEKVVRIQRLLESSVSAVHRFARGLRPAVLDDLGLIPALHAYCKELAARKKFKIEMKAFNGVEALDEAGRTVLFRVAQEALTNVARHARATRVKMSIGEMSGAIRMEITDNGQSFFVDKILLAKNPKRLGLIGMKERIEMVGGSLVIESVLGTGTTVRADIPFNPKKTNNGSL